MDEIVLAGLASTLTVVGVIGWLYVRTHDKLDDHHGTTDRKLDVVRQEVGDVSKQVLGVGRQVEGVRVQMDSHQEARMLEAETQGEEARKFRLSIFRDFIEALKFKRKGDGD